MRPQEPFESLLHRYHGLLFSLGRHYCRRGVDIDDLLQEASVALWRDSTRILTMTVGPAQAALVWKTSRNAMIDILRRTAPTEALPMGLEIADNDHGLMDDLLEQVTLLGEPDNTLVRLQLEGYNYKEIAERTGLTVKNVGVRLTRAKEKLRQQYK